MPKTANDMGNNKLKLKNPSSFVKKMNISKEKKLIFKSLNKENTQGNNIMKKIPTMKKKQITLNNFASDFQIIFLFLLLNVQNLI